MSDEDKDAAYGAGIRAMVEAAAAYARAHPFAEYRFRLLEFERDIAARS